MRTRSSVLSVAALALVCLQPSFAQDRTRAASAATLEAQVRGAAESARARTVLVVGVVGMGSGAVITPRGRVITNAHVVAGARYALCRWSDGEQRLMRRLGVDYAQDLALLEPADPVSAPLPCFTWRGSPPPSGTWVIGMGFPGGYRGDDWPVASLGQITGTSAGNRVNGVFDYDGALRSDTPIFSGNSGGPLIDLEGHLIGLNGAADIQQASALTIPEARIKARLGELEAGWILLPTGLRLNPERTPLLGAFYRGTDRLARQLPERLISRAQSQSQAAGPSSGSSAPDTPGSTQLAEIAGKSPRQTRLRALFERTTVAIRSGEQLLTAIDTQHAVTLSRALRVGERLRAGARSFVVVARSESDDLALLRAEGDPLSAVELASARPIGSLIHALGGDRVLASGIVSARARRVEAGFLKRLRPGSTPWGKALEGLRGAVKRLGIKGISELLEQIDRAQQLRDAFAGGTTPRPYTWVLSIDAPLVPAQLGGPVVDREGRLIGVTVGIAHHGTSYVVPWTRIWQAFSAQLEPAPVRRGALRLY